jgi:hypothetical protein
LRRRWDWGGWDKEEGRREREGQRGGWGKEEEGVEKGVSPEPGGPVDVAPKITCPLIVFSSRDEEWTT